MADKDEMQPVCACCAKKKVRQPEEYRRLIHRLNRIEGQIRGIKGMIEKDAYCTDILAQSAAAGAALNALTENCCPRIFAPVLRRILRPARMKRWTICWLHCKN